MRISAAGNKADAGSSTAGTRFSLRGFTLLELLVVVAVMAIAAAGVTLALRDASQATLQRDAQRLAVLLESARAQSRAIGTPVRWYTTPKGFRFEGLPTQALPEYWLAGDTSVQSGNNVLLGPEPLIGPQLVELASLSQPQWTLHVATDGLRPFAVQETGPP